MRLITNILFLCLFLQNGVQSQDTVFVQKHHFEETVHNVFQGEGRIYVKAGTSVYEKNADGWQNIKQTFTQRFVLFDSTMYETDFLPTQVEFQAASIKHLLPQYSLANSTIAREGNRFFVAVAGSLYEYEVNQHYTRSFHDKSVRDIYVSPELQVISTYDGIFIKTKNGTKAAKGVFFSSGQFWRTPEADYLLVDDLYKRFRPDSFGMYNGPVRNDLGKVRKAVVYNGKNVIQLTFSICWFTPDGKLLPFFRGHEFSDIEVTDSGMLVSTLTGDLFQSDGNFTKKLASAGSRVEDIFESSKGLILATRKGLLKLTKLGNGGYDLEPIVNLPSCHNVVEDAGLNLWVSTDDGLYVIPNGKEQLVIPFIKNVEFNSRSLTFAGDHIYAGSVQGLYDIDYFKFSKIFLPKTLNAVKKENRKRWLYIALSAVGGILIVLVVAGYFFRRRRKKLQSVDLPVPVEKVTSKLSLEKLETDIRTQHLKSVDEIAAFYSTNTVQLNRIMKALDTTPGKFLKKVKLKIAREMLESKAPMDEIVNATGYSAQFIRSELKK